MTMKVKAVVFDLDGTLIDTKERFFRVFNEVLESLSLPPVTRSRFEELYSKALLDEVIPEDAKKDFWKNFLVRYGQVSSDKDGPIPGVRETLKELKDRGLIICVVTGRACGVHSVWNELEKYGLAEHIDVVSAKNSGVKDHYLKEDEVLKALEKVGVKPNDCIVVGDYLADIETGKRIGAFTVAVMSGGVRKEILESAKPDIILESIREIPKIIDAHKGSLRGLLDPAL
ncbi:MAG: HAD family hydrolase [Candidatus Freyarchaeota archaeon]|nr:HAD family hydrolase [Candidatus Jordarchaeia archaeon]